MLVLNVLAAVLVVAFCAALRSGRMPLGVPGEWVWLPVRFGPGMHDLVLAGAGVALYAGLTAVGMTLLARRSTRVREIALVCALVPAALFVQFAVLSGAPVAYGLAKMVLVLDGTGSSGYFRVADQEVDELGPFLAHYPTWVEQQDPFHIGTHPPGLIVVSRVLLKYFKQNPVAARAQFQRAPEPVKLAIRIYGRDKNLSQAAVATLLTIGALTLFACSATVVPLYLLARSALPAPWAWASAALWPLVPSAILFQPTADTAFPMLATTALACAAHAGKSRGVSRWVLSLGCGLALGVGMQFSLVFLPVGLIAGCLVLSERGCTWSTRARTFATIGIGFVGLTCLVWAITSANPFLIWWSNQRNHARFYVIFPRTYRAWLIANPIELAIALGIPVSVWALSSRAVPRVSLITAIVLLFLTVSGKNLSEVARLWIPFMPALAVAAGAGMERAGAGPKSFAAMLGLIGLQTLVVQATIQVVYPV